MAVPPGMAGPAASAMRELLASLPDERKRLEGLQLLDRLIHEERACGGRLAHLTHVYPNLSMPSMHSMPRTPPLGFSSGWGGNSHGDQTLERPVSWARHPDEGKMGYGSDMEGIRLTSFNPLAVAGSTGPQVPPQSWAHTSWGNNMAESPETHLHVGLNGGEDREHQSAENSLGWAGIVKDLELEDEGTLGPVAQEVTQSRILSFVVPTAQDPAVAQGGAEGQVKLGVLPGQLAKCGILDEGQKQQQSLAQILKSTGRGVACLRLYSLVYGERDLEALNAKRSSPGPNAPKFSKVVSLSQQAPPAPAESPASCVLVPGPWKASKGEPIPATISALLPPLQPTSHGSSSSAAPTIGATLSLSIGLGGESVGSRLGTAGNLKAPVVGDPRVGDPRVGEAQRCSSAGGVRDGLPSPRSHASAPAPGTVQSGGGVTAASTPTAQGLSPTGATSNANSTAVAAVAKGAAVGTLHDSQNLQNFSGPGNESAVSVIKKAAAAERRPATNETQDHATPTNAVKPPTPGGTAVSGVVGGGRGAGGAVGGSGGARGWEVAPPPAPLSSRTLAAGDGTKCTATVKLRGLPFSATPQEVLGFFRGFSPVETSVRFGSNQDGRPSGEAWVSFTKVEEAKKAVREKDRHHLGNRYVELFLLNEGGGVASRGGK